MEPIVDIYIPPRGTGGTDSAAQRFNPSVEGVDWVDQATGCASASFTVRDPVTSSALTEDCPVVISCPRSGEVLWTGNVARNGVKRNAFGDSATVRCVGNVDEMFSSYWSLPYIVKDYSEWERETTRYRSATNWTTETTARPADPPWDAIVISIAEGKNCYFGEGGRMEYRGHYGTDMQIGGIAFNADHGTEQNPDGTTPTQLRSELFIGDQGWGKRPYGRVWDTTSSDYALRPTSTSWPEPPTLAAKDPRKDTENYMVFRTRNERFTGVKTTNENVWFAVSKLVVIGQRVDRFGANVYPPATREGITTLWAWEVVEDLLGRCLKGVIDPTLSRVSQVAQWSVSQADYRDPTSPGEVLDDLMMWHPEHLWRVGRRSLTSGLAPLEWRLWDLNPRYLIDESAEIDMDGSPDPLYNRVTIKWVDWKGRPRSKSFDADPAQYPDIASLKGVHEPKPLNLDASLGAMANVDRIGEKWLSVVARRFPSGAITVHGPVLDVQTQQRVPPSQLEAGTTLALTSDEPMLTHQVHEVQHKGLEEAVLSVGRPKISLDHIVSTRGHRRR